jgi:hypothetical protein
MSVLSYPGIHHSIDFFTVMMPAPFPPKRNAGSHYFEAGLGARNAT